MPIFSVVPGRSVRWALLALAAVIGAAWLSAGSGARDTLQGIPLIDDTPTLSVDSGSPPAVVERNEKLIAKAIRQLREIAKMEPSLGAGCKPNDYPGSLGPPAPRVTARIFGHHVEAIVRFDNLPAALVCRPYAVRITIIGKPIRKDLRFPWSQYYQLVGPVGRGVIRLPLYATPPYDLHVVSGTPQNKISRTVKVRLRCPAAGCLDGEARGRSKPRRFPLRGVSREQLEESFRDGVEAIGRSAPYMRLSTRCPSTTVCQVMFTDPLFSEQPYRIRYEIGGEQTAGCWLVRDREELDEPPYDDAYARGPAAGCVSWLG